MIDYETYAKIQDSRDRQGLTITQIARTLGLHRKTSWRALKPKVTMKSAAIR